MQSSTLQNNWHVINHLNIRQLIWKPLYTNKIIIETDSNSYKDHVRGRFVFVTNPMWLSTQFLQTPF